MHAWFSFKNITSFQIIILGFLTVILLGALLLMLPVASVVRNYRMQSKVVLVTTGILILLPTLLFYCNEFRAQPTSKRFLLSLFQAVIPRTAGFNTADLNQMTAGGRAVIILLMLIGGSPGSTAGGMKTTTLAVLFSGSFSVFKRKKNAELFGRRIEDSTVKTAATLLLLYFTLAFAGAYTISGLENLPFDVCIFETASALGTVGLSLGITPSLHLISHLILILLMFFGRVGGLTLIFAAIHGREAEVSLYPVEKIIVG